MESGNKNIGTVSIILLLVIILLGCFIIYDKVLKKDENKGSESCEKTAVVDYTISNVDSEIMLACTVDMTDLTEVDINTKCGDLSSKTDSYQIKLENLKYNDKNYSFTYVKEKDTFVPKDDDPGIIKLYVGPVLVMAHNGDMRNMLKSVKVNGTELEISEWAPSDAPVYGSIIDLTRVIK